MITEPTIEDRSEQHYVGIRSQVAMSELPIVIPRDTEKLFVWLKSEGIAPVGPSFIRYHVINMETKLDIELGVPVANTLPDDGDITAGVIPAGRYASLIYTGDYSGLMDANRVLIEWAQEHGIRWDRWNDANGDAFRSRYESYIIDPADDPDPAKWKTEVAIKLADD